MQHMVTVHILGMKWELTQAPEHQSILVRTLQYYKKALISRGNFANQD